MGPPARATMPINGTVARSAANRKRTPPTTTLQAKATTIAFSSWPERLAAKKPAKNGPKIGSQNKHTDSVIITRKP